GQFCFGPSLRRTLIRPMSVLILATQVRAGAGGGGGSESAYAAVDSATTRPIAQGSARFLVLKVDPFSQRRCALLAAVRCRELPAPSDERGAHVSTTSTSSIAHGRRGTRAAREVPRARWARRGRRRG